MNRFVFLYFFCSQYLEEEEFIDVLFRKEINFISVEIFGFIYIFEDIVVGYLFSIWSVFEMLFLSV